MNAILLWMERQRDKLYRGPLSNFYNHGDFKVVYPDGKRTAWTDYSGCKNLREQFGGVIVHRNQHPTSAATKTGKVGK